MKGNLQKNFNLVNYNLINNWNSTGV